MKYLFQDRSYPCVSGLSWVLNHPSRNFNPSEAYIVITKKIAEIGKLVDILILDHIVIEAGYYNLVDYGM
jgi:DNA repair protein RadC